jgi:hypothetical protein
LKNQNNMHIIKDRSYTLMKTRLSIPWAPAVPSLFLLAFFGDYCLLCSLLHCHMHCQGLAVDLELQVKQVTSCGEVVVEAVQKPQHIQLGRLRSDLLVLEDTHLEDTRLEEVVVEYMAGWLVMEDVLLAIQDHQFVDNAPRCLRLLSWCFHDDFDYGYDYG